MATARGGQDIAEIQRCDLGGAANFYCTHDGRIKNRAVCVNKNTCAKEDGKGTSDDTLCQFLDPRRKADGTLAEPCSAGTYALMGECLPEGYPGNACVSQSLECSVGSCDKTTNTCAGTGCTADSDCGTPGSGSICVLNGKNGAKRGHCGQVSLEPQSGKTWAEAKAYCDALTTGGVKAGTWKLPEYQDLELICAGSVYGLSAPLSGCNKPESIVGAKLSEPYWSLDCFSPFTTPSSKDCTEVGSAITVDLETGKLLALDTNKPADAPKTAKVICTRVQGVE